MRTQVDTTPKKTKANNRQKSGKDSMHAKRTHGYENQVKTLYARGLMTTK